MSNIRLPTITQSSATLTLLVFDPRADAAFKGVAPEGDEEERRGGLTMTQSESEAFGPRLLTRFLFLKGEVGSMPPGGAGGSIKSAFLVERVITCGNEEFKNMNVNRNKRPINDM